MTGAVLIPLPAAVSSPSTMPAMSIRPPLNQARPLKYTTQEDVRSAVSGVDLKMPATGLILTKNHRCSYGGSISQPIAEKSAG
jgi:hypothetical protein